MTEQIIIYVALFSIYYHIGGLSTTNIIRLTRGNELSVISSKCACDNCGWKIPALLQLPIISYIACNGRCKNCETKIPLYPFILECAVMTGMFTISILFDLKPLGIALSFMYYEIIRIITIGICGKRETDFIKNYCIAVLLMIPFFLFSLFVSLIHYII